MPITIGPNSQLWWDQYDLSSAITTGQISVSAAELDVSAWSLDYMKAIRGLPKPVMSASGWLEYDGTGLLAGDVLESVSSPLVAIGASVSAEGDVMYVIQAHKSDFSPFSGSRKDVAAFSCAAAAGQGGWFSGRLLATKAARAASGNSTGVQLGAVPATTLMNAALFVFSASGTAPTLDVTIEHDDNSGFTTPTTALTFAQATAAGAEKVTPTAGPGGADDYWRAKWTIGGTSPSFNFAVVFGPTAYSG